MSQFSPMRKLSNDSATAGSLFIVAGGWSGRHFQEIPVRRLNQSKCSRMTLRTSLEECNPQPCKIAEVIDPLAATLRSIEEKIDYLGKWRKSDDRRLYSKLLEKRQRSSLNAVTDASATCRNSTDPAQAKQMQNPRFSVFPSERNCAHRIRGTLAADGQSSDPDQATSPATALTILRSGELQTER